MPGAVINDVTNKMGNAAVDTTNTMNALNTAIAKTGTAWDVCQSKPAYILA